MICNVKIWCSSSIIGYIVNILWTPRLNSLAQTCIVCVRTRQIKFKTEHISDEILACVWYKVRHRLDALDN